MDSRSVNRFFEKIFGHFGSGNGHFDLSTVCFAFLLKTSACLLRFFST
jgi:hypothetical protein